MVFKKITVTIRICLKNSGNRCRTVVLSPVTLIQVLRALLMDVQGFVKLDSTVLCCDFTTMTVSVDFTNTRTNAKLKLEGVKLLKLKKKNISYEKITVYC